MRRISLVFAIFIIAVTAAMAAETVIVEPWTPYSLALDPVWSPDGRSIAYVTYPCARPISLDEQGPISIPCGPSHMDIATLSGGVWKTGKVINPADSPVWSPDSKQIAYHSDGLVIVNVANRENKRLTTDSPDNVNSPEAWSPNGRYLLYTLNGIAGPTERIRDMKTGKSIGLNFRGSGVWTPAGKLLAWTCGDSPAVMLVDPATGSSKLLLKGSCAAGAFVPKGDAFAYLWLMPSPARGEGVYKLTLKSGALTKMVALRSEEVEWSKDGTQFAAVSKLIPKKGAEPEMNLYVGNTKNWYFKVISKGIATPEDGRKVISWSPDGKSIACATADGGIKIVKL